MNEIHLHTDDIEDLSGNFIDNFGNKMMVSNRLFGYFMQGANIVIMAYTQKQAEEYLKNYKGQIIEPIYFYCA